MPNDPDNAATGGMPVTGETPGGNANTTSMSGATGETPVAGETPQPDAQPTFDAWIATQPETVKAIIDAHVNGLRNSVDTERQQRREFAKQIKDLTGKLDANSDAAKQLGELSANLEAAQKRADFYEKATAAGCVRLKPAFLVAQADGLTVEQVKTQYPELFAATRPPTSNAGSGTQAPPTGGVTMNELIRRAAGKI